MVDQIKVSTFLGNDRIHAIRQAIIACRKGGPRFDAGGLRLRRQVPARWLMQEGLTLKTQRCQHSMCQRYFARPLWRDHGRKIDTTFMISHRMALEGCAEGLKLSTTSRTHTTKIVLKPDMAAAALRKKSWPTKLAVITESLDRDRLRTGAACGRRWLWTMIIVADEP